MAAKKVQHVRIFGGITKTFEKPEISFKRQMDNNPSHPFEVVETNVYVLRRRNNSSTKGICMAVVLTMVTCLIYGIGGGVNEYILLPVLMICYSLYMAIYNIHWKTVVIYTNQNMYEFYVGKHLIYKGHLHNLYIRLKGMKTGGEDIIYNLVLDGYMVDEEVLSASTTTHNKMAKLGRKLAYKLDLNFFDHEDKSRGHVIRHRCPYGVPIAFDFGSSPC